MRVVAPLPPWQIRATFPSRDGCISWRAFTGLILVRWPECDCRSAETARFRPPGLRPWARLQGRQAGGPPSRRDNRRSAWPSQKGAQSSGVILTPTHHGAVKSAERKTPPVRRTARRTSDSGSISGCPSELDERSNDTVVRSFAATTKKRTSKLSVAPSASARLERPAQPRKSPDSKGS